MRVVACSVHRSGRVRAWLQTEAGERVYLTVEDAAFTEGYLDALLEPLERAIRAAQPTPGRSAIHGRHGVSGPENRSQRQP